jgi:hypothetical protein
MSIPKIDRQVSTLQARDYFMFFDEEGLDWICGIVIDTKEGFFENSNIETNTKLVCWLDTGVIAALPIDTPVVKIDVTDDTCSKVALTQNVKEIF